MFIIPKKDGQVWWISDLRELNKCLTWKVYPLPPIHNIVNKQSGYKYSTKIDLTMFYYTLELDKESKNPKYHCHTLWQVSILLNGNGAQACSRCCSSHHWRHTMRYWCRCVHWQCWHLQQQSGGPSKSIGLSASLAPRQRLQGQPSQVWMGSQGGRLSWP